MLIHKALTLGHFPIPRVEPFLHLGLTASPFHCNYCTTFALLHASYLGMWLMSPVRFVFFVTEGSESPLFLYVPTVQFQAS